MSEPNDDEAVSRDAARWRAIRPHLSIDYGDAADMVVDLFLDDFMESQPAAVTPSVEAFVDAIIATSTPNA